MMKRLGGKQFLGKNKRPPPQVSRPACHFSSGISFLVLMLLKPSLSSAQDSACMGYLM
ncbi:MAG: hypothetical protein R2825_10715 [Saprospiraceae bacterium]